MTKFNKALDAFGNEITVGDYVMFAYVDKTEMGRQQTIKESKFVTGKVVGFTQSYVKILQVDLSTLNTKGSPQYRLPAGIGKVEVITDESIKA